MNFLIRPVQNESDKMKFIKSQWNFYKNDKNFVPPIIADRKNILNTKKNPFYEHSEIQLFLAERGGEVIGRIAAITNENHNKEHNDNIGFFGFFECVNEQEVADALFAECEKWLRAKGKDAIRGPENPSQNDDCGLLYKGLDMPSVIMMPYNPEYYIGLIENYGFKKVQDLFAYLLKIDTFVTEKMERMDRIIRERYKVEMKTVDFKHKKQFLQDLETIKSIYNCAWVPNWGFVKMTDKEMDHLANDLKLIADPNLAFFIYSKGKVAGFALALPDINQVLKFNKKGGMLGALWHLKTKKKRINLVRIIILGILPEFQRMGLDSCLYYEFLKKGLDGGYMKGEASWILEDNEKMNRGLTQTMNAEHYKTYRIFQKSI